MDNLVSFSLIYFFSWSLDTFIFPDRAVCKYQKQILAHEFWIMNDRNSLLFLNEAPFCWDLLLCLPPSLPWPWPSFQRTAPSRVMLVALALEDLQLLWLTNAFFYSWFPFTKIGHWYTWACHLFWTNSEEHCLFIIQGSRWQLIFKERRKKVVVPLWSFNAAWFQVSLRLGHSWDIDGPCSYSTLALSHPEGL